MNKLPVFDVSALANGRSIAALREACEGIGFFYIADHGVGDALIETAAAQMRQFFALPLEQRMAVALKLSSCNRGYEPMQTQTLEPGMPPDLKEGFYAGNDLAADHPHVRTGYFNQGPNQWPAGLPAFRPAMEAYFAALESLVTTLMRAMALSLDLPADHFAAFCEQPMSLLRLLHYPPQPPNPRARRKGLRCAYRLGLSHLAVAGRKRRPAGAGRHRMDRGAAAAGHVRGQYRRYVRALDQ